jgi:putative SOS response-associated peptidase YedK
MCGRFTLTDPAEAMARLFDARPDNDLPAGPRFNICPTQAVLAVTSESGTRRLRALRWGFVPAWYDTPTGGPLLINARAETVAEKPAFRAAIRARRCLIPASGYYEWQTMPDGEKLPYYIRRADGAPLVLAGLWQTWARGDAGLTACATLTTAAGPCTAHIHDREPVLVDPADWPLWLGEAGHGAARLLRAAAPGVLVAQRVGKAVNSNRAEGAGLIEPLDATP